MLSSSTISKGTASSFDFKLWGFHGLLQLFSSVAVV